MFMFRISFSWKYVKMAKKYNFLLFFGKVLEVETCALDILDNGPVQLK